jgi:uncharacterized membrane protein
MKQAASTFSQLDTNVSEHKRDIELLISNLLRGGVIISLIFVLVGTFISFIHHPNYLTSPSALALLTGPGGTFPRTLPDLESGFLNLRGQTIVTIGLIILVATPVMRVAISIFAFIYQGNKIFTLITILVLCLLLMSFILGKAV